ncbi:hypothetical protein AG1IA_01946 [Rhizoctonia solani AG-1 IA]|uniref:PAS domain-containing protein n=1 Tax=Thanatephorus cucumeris (strain AG1-IA) TaxID=983506 RepID=L8X1C0_THACA|nr:hypothetical protein AG1IA_01946 [Rhizoctonia solani AG-1 IA]
MRTYLRVSHVSIRAVVYQPELSAPNTHCLELNKVCPIRRVYHLNASQLSSTMALRKSFPNTLPGMNLITPDNRVIGHSEVQGVLEHVLLPMGFAHEYDQEYDQLYGSATSSSLPVCYSKFLPLEFVYASESITDVLGFEQHHVLQRGITDLVDDYEQEDVARALNTIVRENKAASLLYLHLLHAQQQRFIVCQMTISVAGNVIVGSICQAALDAIGSTARDQSAEELIVAVNESVSYPGISVCHCPRTGLGLDIDDLWAAAEVPCNRLDWNSLSKDCAPIRPILNNESCVERRGGLFRYVAPQDEASNFITRLKQSGIEANAPTNVGFVYHTFNLCVAGRDSQASGAQAPPNGANEIRVSAVGSASSDGLTLVLKLEP